jgi:carboxypeptidase D
MDALSPDQQPVGIDNCEGVMNAVLEPFSKVVDGTEMCMNVYDIRLMDTAPACGMNWPPDLKQVTPWLRVRFSRHEL